MANNNPMTNVTFSKAQLKLLEQMFGTYDKLAVEITVDSSLVLLNRKAGQQDVLQAIRERTIG